MNDSIENDFLPISIIIVNFNGRMLLENCLDSVIKTNYPNFHVIVVDNGSSEDITELIRHYSQESTVKISLIKNKKNLGFAEANNIGFKQCSGKYVAFLNNDTVVDSNWLQSMVAILENNEKVAAVQSVLLTKDGLRVDSVGGVMDIFGTAEDKVVPLGNLNHWVASNSDKIFSFCAAAVLIRRDVFVAVGGFDSRFFAYYEDVDLSWRIRLHGYSLVIDTNSVVYHMRSGTSKRFKTKMFDFHLYKNQIAMIIKNYDWKNVAKVMPGLLSLYFFRLTYCVINNDAQLGIATLKALSWNIKEFPYVFCKRKIVQTCVRRVVDDQVTKFMSKIPIQMLSQSESF
jgi:GT2 family glycosyltransferase